MVKLSKDLLRFDNIKTNRYLWPGITITVIIILAVFVGPKLTGFTVFSSSLGECKEDLGTCADNVDSLTTQKIKLEENLATAQNTISEKNTELARLDSVHKFELDDVQKQYDDLANTFNAIVDNAGTNRCCKEKYDDDAINSFNIKNDKITCVTDGTFKIEC